MRSANTLRAVNEQHPSSDPFLLTALCTLASFQVLSFQIPSGVHWIQWNLKKAEELKTSTLKNLLLIMFHLSEQKKFFP